MYVLLSLSLLSAALLGVLHGSGREQVESQSLARLDTRHWRYGIQLVQQDSVRKGAGDFHVPEDSIEYNRIESNRIESYSMCNDTYLSIVFGFTPRSVDVSARTVYS
jgi:hypothetical protein